MPEKTAQKEPGKKPAPSKKPKPQQEVVVQIPLLDLHPFPDHPFQVREDASMQETAASVAASWQGFKICPVSSATSTGTLPPSSWWTATSSEKTFFPPNAPKPTR